ncbi:EF-hand domain-containing protein [uncultured Ruegeria sp.]|uniref:EF-hand domain-containing protein n=1 Tax=uncultured Ruegeria sp. TaxID=259304 RepID=UPI002634AB0F|nr:EF-hand domain-containing protein [uncultured Ruegeria sp.]
MRKEKKSESLEVRLSLSEKNAFASRVESRGETMSAALRRLIAEDGVPHSKTKEASTLKKITIAASPVVLTVAILAAVSLAGASAKTDFAGNFRAKDTNGDGFVDRMEMLQHMTQQAAEVNLPSDCDGTELAKVWSMSPQELAEDAISFSDADNDGRITLSEVVAANERFRADDFTSADTNEDGFVSLAELEYGFREDEAKVSAECRAAIGMHSAARAPEILKQLDTDGDGRISLGEFVNH